MPFGVVETTGSLTFDNYTCPVLTEALDVRRRDEATRVLALFKPSFHPETLVVLSSRPEETRITVSAFERSLWGALNDAEVVEYTPKQRLLHKHRGVPLPKPPLPSVWWSEADLDRVSEDEVFSKVLPLFHLAEKYSESCAGIDGITLYGRLEQPKLTASSFEAWSPKPSTPRHTYFRFLYELALDRLREPRVQTLLEGLHAYLELGLPAVLHREAVPRLRLFGVLSSQEEAPLRAKLHELSDEAPAIIHVRNLTGVAGLLYEMFREWLRMRRGPTGWLVSESTDLNLEALEVPMHRRFDDLETAIQALLA